MKRLLIIIICMAICAVCFAAPSIADSAVAVQNAQTAATDTANAVSQAAADGRESLISAMEFTEDHFDWHRDWWKLAVMALTILLCILVLIYTAKVILKFFVLVICAFLSLLAALCLHKVVHPYVLPYLPESLGKMVSLDYVTIFLLAVGSFIIISMVALALVNTYHSLLKVPSGKEEKK